jgi:hypothetical protein
MIRSFLALVFAIASAGIAQAQCANGQCALPQRFAPSVVAQPQFYSSGPHVIYQTPQRTQFYGGGCANGQCGIPQAYQYAPRARYYYRPAPRVQYYYYVR